MVKQDRHQLEQAVHQPAPKELAAALAAVVVLPIILAVVAEAQVVTPEMGALAARQVLVQMVPVAAGAAAAQPMQVKDTAEAE